MIVGTLEARVKVTGAAQAMQQINTFGQAVTASADKVAAVRGRSGDGCRDQSRNQKNALQLGFLGGSAAQGMQGQLQTFAAPTDFLQRTGAGPVEARIISRGCNISWRGGPPSKTIRAARRPFWTPNPSTVVSGGLERSASGISL
jgi:hypothetical protein